MKLNFEDVNKINQMVYLNDCFGKQLEIMVFKNNRPVSGEPQYIKNQTQFTNALKALEGFKFEYASNGMVGFREIENDNDSYHIQIKPFNGVQYAKEIEL